MKLAIIGCGEMAEELFNLVVSCDKQNEYEDIFFVDLEGDISKNIIAESNYFKTNREESEILIAMGEPAMRKKMADKYTREGFKMTTFVHPFSFVSPNVVIGAGSIILPFVYIAQNTEIGSNIIFHSGCIIENDCLIGNNCFVSSNAFIGAKTSIEDTCFLGPSSAVRDSIRIGHDCIIGMGSVITKNVVENSVCYGNPAKIVRENTNHKVFK